MYLYIDVVYDKSDYSQYRFIVSIDCPLRDPNWNKNIVLYCIVYYYYEYVNMYLVCTYNMARYYFHIVILSVFLYKTVCISLQSNTYLFVPYNYNSGFHLIYF